MDLARNVACFFEICNRIDFKSFFFNNLVVKEESLSDIEKKTNDNNITLKNSVPAQEENKSNVPQKKFGHLHSEKYFHDIDVYPNGTFSTSKTKLESFIPSDEQKWIIYQETSNDISSHVEINGQAGIPISCCGTQKFKEVTTLDPMQLAELQNNKTLIRRPLYRTRFVAIRHKRINPTLKQQPCKRNDVSFTTLPEQIKQSDSATTFPLQNFYLHQKNENKENFIPMQKNQKFYIPGDIDNPFQNNIKNDFTKSYVTPEFRKYASVSPCFQQPLSTNFVPYNFTQNNNQYNFSSKSNNEEINVPRKEYSLPYPNQYKLSQTNKDIYPSFLNNHFLREPIKDATTYQKFVNFNQAKQNPFDSSKSFHINLDATSAQGKNLPSKPTTCKTKNDIQQCNKWLKSPTKNRTNTFRYNKIAASTHSKSLSNTLNKSSTKPNALREYRADFHEATEKKLLPEVSLHPSSSNDFRFICKSIQEADLEKSKKFIPQPIASYNTKPLTSSLPILNPNDKKYEINQKKINFETLQKIKNDKDFRIKNVFFVSPLTKTLTMSKIPTKTSMNFRERETNKMQTCPYDEGARRVFVETKLQPPQSTYKENTTSPYGRHSASSYTRYDVNSQNMMVYPQSLLQIEKKLLHQSPDLPFDEIMKRTTVNNKVQQAIFPIIKKQSIDTKPVPLSYNEQFQRAKIPLFHSPTSQSGHINLQPILHIPNTTKNLNGSTDQRKVEASFFPFVEEAVNEYKQNVFLRRQHVNQKEQMSNCLPYMTQQAIQQKDTPYAYSSSTSQEMYVPQKLNVQTLTTTPSRKALNGFMENADFPCVLRIDKIKNSTLTASPFFNDNQIKRKMVPMFSLPQKTLSFLTNDNGNVSPSVQGTAVFHSFNKSNTLRYMPSNANGIDPNLCHHSFIKEQDIHEKQLPLSAIHSNINFTKTDQLINTSIPLERETNKYNHFRNHQLYSNPLSTNIINDMIDPMFLMQRHRYLEKDSSISFASPQRIAFDDNPNIDLKSSFQSEKSSHHTMEASDAHSNLLYRNVNDPALSTQFFINGHGIPQQSYPVSSSTPPDRQYTIVDKESNAVSPIETKGTFSTSVSNNDLDSSQRNDPEWEPTLYSQFPVKYQKMQDNNFSTLSDNVTGNIVCLENENTTTHHVKNSYSHHNQQNDGSFIPTSCPVSVSYSENLQTAIENFPTLDIKGLSFKNEHYYEQNFSNQDKEVFTTPTNGSSLVNGHDDFSPSKRTVNGELFKRDSSIQNERQVNSLKEKKPFCILNENNNKPSQSTQIEKGSQSATKRNNSFSSEYEEEIKKAMQFQEFHKDSSKITSTNQNCSSLDRIKTPFPSRNKSEKKVFTQNKEYCFNSCSGETTLVHLNKKNDEKEADSSSVDEVNRVNSSYDLSSTKEIFYTFAEENIQQLPSANDVNNVGDDRSDFGPTFVKENDSSRDMEVLSDTSSYRKRKEVFSEKVFTANKQQNFFNSANKNEILSYIEDLRKLSYQLKHKNCSESTSVVKKPRLKLHSTDSKKNESSNMFSKKIKEKALDRMNDPNRVEQGDSTEFPQHIAIKASKLDSSNKQKTIKSLFNEIQTLREERNHLHKELENFRVSMKEDFKDLIDLTDDSDFNYDFSSPKDMHCLDLREIPSSEDKSLLLCLWDFLLKNEKDRFEDIPSTLLQFCSNLQHRFNNEENSEKQKFSLKKSFKNQYKKSFHKSSKLPSFRDATSSFQSDSGSCISQSSSFYETSEQKPHTECYCENRSTICAKCNLKNPISQIKPLCYGKKKSPNTGRQYSKSNESRECQQTSRCQSESLGLNSPFLVDLTTTSRTSSEDYHFSDTSSSFSQSPLIPSRLPVKPPFVPKIKNISLLGVSSWNSGKSTAGEFIPEDLTNLQT